MDIKEFAETLKEKVSEQLGKEVRVHQVTKNNGVVLQGLMIIETDSNVSPTIYLESLWEAYQCGVSMKEIIQRICQIYKQDRVASIDMSWFKDFEQVKDRLAYKLINLEYNRELLEEIPYKRVLDLAKVYYVSVVTEEIGEGTILIRNNHMDMWGVTPEQLDSIAEENTPKLFPAQICSMFDIIDELSGDSMDKEKCKKNIPDIGRMYVVSNPSRVFGAAVMCYKDVFHEIAMKYRSSLYILPSSVHELIIIVPRLLEKVSELRAMVYEVNRTTLEKQDRLSDSVYYYDCLKHTITTI